MTQTSDPAVAILRYSRVAMGLHWLTALAIAFEIVLGLRMEGLPGATTFAVYQLHKSIGVSILALTLARVFWRLTHRPPSPEGGKAWERRLAGLVHAGFYGLLLAIPLSGWLMVSASAIGIDTVLFGVLPFPHIPGVPGLEPASKAGVEDAAETAHRLLGWALFGLLALHVIGAMKHHLIDRDHGLARIIPGPARLRRLDPRLIAVGVAVTAVMIIATTYPWRPARTFAAVPVPVVTAPAPLLPAPLLPTPEAVAPPAEEPLSPAPVAGADPGPVAVEPSLWRVRDAESRLAFSTTWSGLPIRGGFRTWSADIVFSPEALQQSRVRVVVDMASFNTEDSDSRSMLAGSDWFDVATHSRATFTADRFLSLGADRYEARGTLQLKGVSSPATLRFTLTIDGDTARMTGTANVTRTTFGVGKGEWESTNDIPGPVAVETTIVATRAGP